ncbi:MAG: hypothetical protein P8Y67_15305 [Alphaproteobacteria bacterium]
MTNAPLASITAALLTVAAAPWLKHATAVSQRRLSAIIAAFSTASTPVM